MEPENTLKETQHAYSRYGPKSLRAWYNNYKKTLQCSRCPEKHPGVLEFHHEDPTIKDDNITSMVHHGTLKNKEAILTEMKKCVVLCANCHRKEHWMQTQVTQARDDAKWKNLFEGRDPQEVLKQKKANFSKHMKQLWQTSEFRETKIKTISAYNERCKHDPALAKERGERIRAGRLKAKTYRRDATIA